MHAKRVPTVKELLNPEARGWAQVEMTRIEMMATPLGMQPTEYIRVSWENHPYGQLKEIGVRVVHDGAALAVWLRWDAPERHDADGVAVALPVHGQPALMTMGMPDAPIHALQWIAAKPGVRSVFATGIGSSRLGPEVGASAQAAWKNGQWSVVVTRVLGTGKDIAPLMAGKETSIGFAIWNGANGERAGLKAFSVDWKTLALDA